MAMCNHIGHVGYWPAYKPLIWFLSSLDHLFRGLAYKQPTPLVYRLKIVSFAAKPLKSHTKGDIISALLLHRPKQSFLEIRPNSEHLGSGTIFFQRRDPCIIAPILWGLS